MSAEMDARGAEHHVTANSMDLADLQTKTSSTATPFIARGAARSLMKQTLKECEREGSVSRGADARAQKLVAAGVTLGEPLRDLALMSMQAQALTKQLTTLAVHTCNTEGCKRMSLPYSGVNKTTSFQKEAAKVQAEKSLALCSAMGIGTERTTSAAGPCSTHLRRSTRVTVQPHSVSSPVKRKPANDTSDTCKSPRLHQCVDGEAKATTGSHHRTPLAKLTSGTNGRAQGKTSSRVSCGVCPQIYKLSSLWPVFYPGLSCCELAVQCAPRSDNFSYHLLPFGIHAMAIYQNSFTEHQLASSTVAALPASGASIAAFEQQKQQFVVVERRIDDLAQAVDLPASSFELKRYIQAAKQVQKIFATCALAQSRLRSV